MAIVILGAMSRTIEFKGTKKAFSYAHLLTHIFMYFGIDFASEPHKVAATVMNHTTINHIAYKLVEKFSEDEEKAGVHLE